MRGNRLFYGWIIVGVAFVTLAVSFGVWYSFSVFFVAILREFSWSRGATVGVFSIFIMVYCSIAIVIGSVLDRFGPRVVLPLGSLLVVLGLLVSSRIQALWEFYLFYGVLTAIGISSIGHISHSIFLPNWFLKKRGLALGIAMAGIGVGILVFVPLAQFIISRLGWRMAYCVLAGIVLAVVLPINAVFQRKNPKEIGAYPDGGRNPSVAWETLTIVGTQGVGAERIPKELTLHATLRSTRFWFLFLTYFFTPFATQGTLMHQVAHAVDRGFSAEEGAFFFGLMGIMGSVGKILFGDLSDRISREKAFATGIGCAFSGVLCMLALQPGYSALLYGYAVLFGLGYGSAPPLLAARAADLFHGPHFGKVYGFLAIALGLGGATGTWVNGEIFDMTSSYSVALVLANSAFAFVAFLFWKTSPTPCRKWESNKTVF